MPCYNQARFLPEAVQSLQAQTYPHWECLIVNDGSTDETEQVAQTLSRSDDRIRFFSQPNGGLSAARNRGLAEARGQYLQFLDADDLIEPEKLNAQARHLDHSPADDTVYSDVRYFPDGDRKRRLYSMGKREYPWLVEMAQSKEPTFTKLLARNIMAVNCPLVRRSLIEKVGTFDQQLRAYEDWDYWLRCAARGASFRFVGVPNGLALVRSHSGSMSRDDGRMFEAQYRVRLKISRSIADPALKLRNFELAASALEELNSADRLRRLLRLAKANSSARVWLNALLRIVDTKQLLRGLASTGRNALHAD